MGKGMQHDPLMSQIDGTNKFPYRFEGLENAVKQKLRKEAFDYIQSGAGAEETLKNNRQALEETKVIPRMLQSVTNLDTSVELFGHHYETPVLLAPIGMQKLANSGAEIATARAAQQHQVPMVVSTASTFALEDIAKAVPNHPLWYQLYWSELYPEVAFNMAKRAEQAGYHAIVLTVDTVMLGWRERDLDNQFSPLKAGYGFANYKQDAVFMSHLDAKDDDSIVKALVENFYHPSLNWGHVERLKKATNLPIIIKGLLHPEDARLALEHGADGIIVSNHGGRQLDGVVGSAAALPEIAKQVNGKVPILFDSGIRRGADVVKALALGADAVLLGRPFMYGLALDGEAGVSKVLEHFLADMRASFGLAGAADVRAAKALDVK